jgi:hypothetical protein
VGGNLDEEGERIMEDRLEKFIVYIEMEVEAYSEDEARDKAYDITSAYADGESTIEVERIDESDPWEPARLS